jgi:hypothetical protein
MKNIQIIDGSINSIFEVFEVDEGQFNMLFPNNNNIAFIDDFPELDDDINFWNSLYNRRIDKISVNGIHGTLHLTGSYVEKEEFPNRKESDVF